GRARRHDARAAQALFQRKGPRQDRDCPCARQEALRQAPDREEAQLGARARAAAARQGLRPSVTAVAPSLARLQLSWPAPLTPEGESPKRRRNMRLKWEMSPNPTASAISVIRRCAKRRSVSIA